MCFKSSTYQVAQVLFNGFLNADHMRLQPCLLEQWNRRFGFTSTPVEGLLYLCCVGLYRKEPRDWLMADQAILVSTKEVTASQMCLDLKGQPLNPSMWRKLSNIRARLMKNAFYSENVVILIVW